MVNDYVCVCCLNFDLGFFTTRLFKGGGEKVIGSSVTPHVKQLSTNQCQSEHIEKERWRKQKYKSHNEFQEFR